jgi:hypothetical protein
MTSGVIDILASDTTVRALIGQNLAGNKYKVFPGICPIPEQHPYLVVRRTGKSPVQCKGGFSGLVPQSFEVIAYHKSYDKLDDIEEAVEAALNGKVGTYGGVTFRNIHLTNAFDADYIISHELHARVLEFQAMTITT